jgi:hypothetical protein
VVNNFVRFRAPGRGHNLDIFQQPGQHTADGSVNLAHRRVGSEDALGLTRSLTLKLIELPHQVLGMFPTFYATVDGTAHRRLGSAHETPSSWWTAR